MKKTTIMALGLGFLVAGSALANHHSRYLPLNRGNEWTYLRTNRVARFAPWTVSVDRSYGTLSHLTGFPGLPEDKRGYWVLFRDSTLSVWSWDHRRWATFLRFGAPVGTTYQVDLGISTWRSAQVHIKSRSHTLENHHLNLTHKDVVHFVFKHTGLADAGVQEYLFAPGYGLVNWVEQSFVGPTTGWLGWGRIAGSKFGRIAYKELESGTISSYPLGTTNKILLINSKVAWENFYRKHKPFATTVPSIDFRKNTVAVVLAGQRNTGGYRVSLSGAWYDYPRNYSGRFLVYEWTPAGPVILIITSPYAIYVLDTKVYTGSKEWKTSLSRTFDATTAGS